MSYLEISHFIQWFFILGLMFMVYKLIKLVGKNANKQAHPNMTYNKKSLSTISGYSITTNEKIEITKNADFKSLVFFVTPGCIACKEIINNMHQFINKGYNIVFVSREADNSQLEFYVENLKIHQIPLIISDKISEENEVSAFPFAILLSKGLLVEKATIASNINRVKDVFFRKKAV
ncbi:thioredoxin family protein [Bacillus sp. A17A.1]